MSEPSGDPPSLPGGHEGVHPKNYRSTEAKARFAVAKYYGMGPDGEWDPQDIADELDVSRRRVYQLLNESQIAEETREVLATTHAEWRLDMAVQLRREVKRLEEIEQELLERKEAVPVAFEERTVHGTPTGDRNISLSDHSNEYKLKIPVPTDFETVTDYGPDLERVQKEKRNYLQQIAKLLGLEKASRREMDETLATRHEEVKVVEFREVDGDDYPDQDVIDVDGTVDHIEGDVEDAGGTEADD